MGGDPAAPITPSQIGIPLLISQRKEKKECLSSASRHQSCAAGSTTAAMLLRNMQSDGTAQVLTVCMIRYTTREREREESTGSSRCRLQIADCRLQSGAWNLRPTGVAILLCPLHLNSEWINWGDTLGGQMAHMHTPKIPARRTKRGRKDENSTHARVGCSLVN